MMAVVTVEVVRSGQIQNIFSLWSQQEMLRDGSEKKNQGKHGSVIYHQIGFSSMRADA